MCNILDEARSSSSTRLSNESKKQKLVTHMRRTHRLSGGAEVETFASEQRSRNHETGANHSARSSRLCSQLLTGKGMWWT
uniref:Uncharacterized protein n=1 Tax=Physcomitrium patens TaxID=3218 RepID=A0A2K1IJK7_PHYPA|nr:hypothetical protein PHYPA_028153 [Physcomitrium patens]